MKDKEKDYDIIEEEDFSPENEKHFSHQQLVMRTMKKCLDNSSKEMRAGVYNTKIDKNGNTIITPIEDTRKTFIESVETVEMIMECDIDKKARDKIKELKTSLSNAYKKLCNEEAKDWLNLTLLDRQKRLKDGIKYKEGRLNLHLLYYQDYMEEQVRIARMIFKELTKLTSRLGFYEEESLIM